MLAAVQSARIVIDGLDERDEKDHTPVLSILEPLSKTSSGSCKVLVSSRDVGTIFKFLHQKPTINLKDEYEDVNGSIRQFVERDLLVVRERFEGSADLFIDDIQAKLVQKANGEGHWALRRLVVLSFILGMFLWARLVLATLREVHSIQELKLAVESLPEGLDEALVEVSQLKQMF